VNSKHHLLQTKNTYNKAIGEKYYVTFQEYFY
jgi:hypothetical protein